MSQSTKKRLIKRLNSYYQLEGMNAVFFFCLSIYIIYNNELRDVIFLTFGLWFMVFVLIQGTIYWKLKLKSLKSETINHNYFVVLFKRFKYSNLVLGFMIPILFLIQWFASGKTLEWNSILFWGWFTNLFALIEHYNYYNRQLMYDNPHDWKYLKRNKRLKIASLKKDLEEQEF